LMYLPEAAKGFCHARLGTGTRLPTLRNGL
jgi:hypothetical protein